MGIKFLPICRLGFRKATWSSDGLFDNFHPEFSVDANKPMPSFESKLGAELIRFLHDQVMRTGILVSWDLVQTLVQLCAVEAPIAPLGSSLLR